MPSPPAASYPLWRHRDFVRLWAGQTISVYGSLVTRLALPWLAIGLGARPAQLALLAAPSAAALGIALMVAQQLITDPAVTIYEVAAVSLRQRLMPDALLGHMNPMNTRRQQP